MKKLIIDFIPWIIYGIASHFMIQPIAIIIPLIYFFTAGGITKLKKKMLIDWLTVIWLIAIFTLSFIPNFPLNEYKWIILNFALAVMAWISISIRTPFTMQYAKQKVSEDKWNSPIFIKINYILTSVWAIIFTLSIIIRIVLKNNPSLISTTTTVLVIVGVLISMKFPAIYSNLYNRRLS
ncbi:MAG: hypothetical protein GY756_09165 [bacterium]|nr:hypothetical protein [bacterium]